MRIQSILTTFIIIFLGLGIIFFFLYGRARMQENKEKEQLFLRIHFTLLGLVALLGLIWMMIMVETAD